MSSTNRGAQRAEGDSYQTPQELADFLVAKLVADRFLSNPEPRVCEPSAGDGNFVAALRRFCDPGYLVAVELQPTATRDARYSELKVDSSVDGAFENHYGGTMPAHYSAIVGNPPYSLAEQHIRHALDRLLPARGGTLAFLLRLAFLESRARAPFWKQYRCKKIYSLVERPSFVGGKTDSSAYGFFVWQTGYKGKTELEVVSWKGQPLPPAVSDEITSELPEWPED